MPKKEKTSLAQMHFRMSGGVIVHDDRRKNPCWVQICIRHRKLKRLWKSNARLRERLEGDRTRALVAQGAQVNSLQSGEDES